MIRVEMDQAAVNRIQESLSTFSPRLTRKVYRELREILYRELGPTLIRHFLCCRPPDAPPVPRILTIRTGRLFNSVLKSLRISESGGRLTISIGSNVPYAAIHEYGGGYIPPRPYLRPTMKDLEHMLPSLLERAIQQLNPTRLVSESQ